MLSNCARLLWVLGPVAAQDLFEKEQAFLAPHDVARQALNLNKTSSSYKLITPRDYDDWCLDVPGGNVANGQVLWLWECEEEHSKQNNQIWIFDSSNNQIRFGSDERFCIDASEMSDGTQMMLWECNGLAQQQWGWDAHAHRLYLPNTNTGYMCLDFYKDDRVNGQPLHVWGCNDKSNQQWSLWSSDRPTRKVFPSDHCEYETGDWPWFDSKEELQKDKYWSAYFTAIYGGVPSFGYPICTGAFQFLWQTSAASTGVVQQAVTDCPGPTGSGQELEHGTYFSGQSFLDAQHVFGNIYNPELFHASAPAKHWVEVSHTAFPGDKGATWYYMAVGSGVWLNVGATKTYKDHPDMVKDMLGTACLDNADDHFGTHPTECEQNFLQVFTAATAKGLNTIQLTHHYDCTCGPKGDSSYIFSRLCPTEIIALDNTVGGGAGCSSLLRGGWEASTGCNCDETFKDTTHDQTDCQNGCHYANCGAI